MIVALIQARMGSTRLPGKVLKDLCGKPMLCHVVERVSRSKYVNQVVVATSTKPIDQHIVNLCRRKKILFLRGSENNVLSRFYLAIERFPSDVYLRITADCPFIDPLIIDKVCDRFLKEKPDYASNTLELTYPRGLDIEVFTKEALIKTYQEATEPLELEHVTYYMRHHPEKFKLLNVPCTIDYSKHRWTVDTIEDLQLALTIYKYFKNNSFSWTDILDAMEAHPLWQLINAHIQQKPS